MKVMWLPRGGPAWEGRVIVWTEAVHETDVEVRPDREGQVRHLVSDHLDLPI
jgi:hypothetical protein